MIKIIILGSIVGSFIKCLIDRYPNYLIKRYSYCLNCNKKIKYYDLIPILSYILLKGRCRYCNYKININLFYMEILFSFAFLLINALKNNVFIYIIFCCFFIASIIDIKYMEIPDICFIIITFYSLLFNKNLNIYLSLSILFIGSILSLLNLMGFGDIKLLSSLSLSLNYITFQYGLILSCIIGIISFIFTKNKTIKFAPCISIGFFIIFLIFY